MNDPATDELAHRLAVLEVASRHFPGVAEIEHLLDGFLRLFKAGRPSRPDAACVLIELVQSWPWGAVELIEFTMRDLQWQEVRDALEHCRAAAADFRHRDLASRALEVFEDDWPGGEIYVCYRDSV